MIELHSPSGMRLRSSGSMCMTLCASEADEPPQPPQSEWLPSFPGEPEEEQLSSSSSSPELQPSEQESLPSHSSSSSRIVSKRAHCGGRNSPLSKIDIDIKNMLSL